MDKTTRDKIIDVCDNLNIDYSESAGDEELLPLVITLANDIIIVNFMGTYLWDSDNKTVYLDNNECIDFRKEFIERINKQIEFLKKFSKQIKK
jgi:hypothetical protein